MIPLKCWQCRKPFNKRDDGSPIFTTYVDAIGNEHKVHKICGETLGPRYRQITAQPGDELENMAEFHSRQEDARETRLARKARR